jgi:hypothetical protein
MRMALSCSGVGLSLGAFKDHNDAIFAPMSRAAPPFLGVVMLDTRFPRPPGDIGHPETFARAGIAVRYRRVSDASPTRVVLEADVALHTPFVQAMQALAAEGAGLISTSCGFLAAQQPLFARAVPVPVISSSLLQCAHLARPGIVTFDAAALTPAVLQGADVPVGTPIEGLTPGCEHHRRILRNETQLELAAAEQDVVQAALRLVQRHPEVQNIVLECTNMPPYRAAVEKATGRPVHDIETLLIRSCQARFTHQA